MTRCTTSLRPGDRVLHRDATAPVVGVVRSVREGAWSNGGIAMVTVEWPNGSRSQHTASALLAARLDA